LYSDEVFEGSTCVDSLVGLAQCTQGPSSQECCAAIGDWNRGACWCSQAGGALLDTMPALLAPAWLESLGVACGVASTRGSCSPR
jgi:hypothetical protein